MAELFRMSSNEQREGAAHEVDWFADVCFPDLLQLSILCLIELNHRIPPTADDNVFAAYAEHAHVFHWHARRLSHWLCHLLSLWIAAVPSIDASVRVGDVHGKRLLLSIHLLSKLLPADS